MELPKRMPAKTEHRLILGEFYDINKNKQWFDRAELIELHPNHMKPTIEIYCSYNPVLEMKEILQFASGHNIAVEVIARSNQG
jgi:ketol-acid reductoisomerase